MNFKKILAMASLIILLSVSWIILSMPVIKADTPDYFVAGFVYINGEKTDGIEVIVSVPGYENRSNISHYDADYDLHGLYKIGFYADQGQYANFTLHFGNNYVTPTPSNLYIDHPHPYFYYNVNLSITNDQPSSIELISPTDGSKVGSENKATLTVRVTDPDGHKMDVSFYDASTHAQIGGTQVNISSGSTASIVWSGLSAGTIYRWYAVADDGLNTTQSDTWSFTTKSSGGGGNNNPSPPPPPPPPPANQPPVADAGGPYFGLVSQSITFNGSSSYDPDGSITNYTWDFGDGSTGYGVSPTHIYNSAGIYTVTLTVTDNSNATNAVDTNTTTATISEKSFNYPPSIPIVSGPSTGHVNMSYNFTAISTDNDSATIQYTFNWGDGETTTTEFVPNGTAVHLNHTWHVPGNYTIRVMAYDNNTISGTATHYIEITVMSEEPTNNSGATNSLDYTVYYVAAILIILLILIFLLGRKKKKT